LFSSFACLEHDRFGLPQGIAALVLVAPAIVALRLGRHEAQEAAAQEEALEQGDEVGAARARASFAEFRSNTASTLMCGSSNSNIKSQFSQIQKCVAAWKRPRASSAPTPPARSCEWIKHLQAEGGIQQEVKSSKKCWIRTSASTHQKQVHWQKVAAMPPAA